MACGHCRRPRKEILAFNFDQLCWIRGLSSSPKSQGGSKVMLRGSKMAPEIASWDPENSPGRPEAHPGRALALPAPRKAPGSVRAAADCTSPSTSPGGPTVGSHWFHELGLVLLDQPLQRLVRDQPLKTNLSSLSYCIYLFSPGKVGPRTDLSTFPSTKVGSSRPTSATFNLYTPRTNLGTPSTNLHTPRTNLCPPQDQPLHLAPKDQPLHLQDQP